MFKKHIKTGLYTVNFSSEPKRPWTIKVFVIVFGLLYGLSLSQFLGDFTKPLLFIYTVSIVVSVYGIWQGRYWARNLFFILTLPMIFLLLLGSSAILIGMKDIKEMFTSMWALFVVFLYLLIFLKPSNEWFEKVNSDSDKSDTNQLAWQVQLMIVIIAIILGIFAEVINFKLDLIPLMSQLAKNFVSPYTKITFAVSINTIGFLIGSIVTLLPFVVLMGIWKKKLHFLIGRLISIGVIIPLIFVFFILGKNRVNIYIFLFFLASMIAAIVMIYLGLVLSTKVNMMLERLHLYNKFGEKLKLMLKKSNA